MFIGVIYAIVIFLACVIGAIVGLGGGVFIRPIFEAIGEHSNANIAFLASTAILSMAVVSTAKKLKDGLAVKVEMAALISIGAVGGGVLGDLLRQLLLNALYNEASLQLIQNIVTVLVLAASIFATTKNNLRYEIKSLAVLPFIGIGLGTIASFLAIGGGPINVPILMIFFGLPIKIATSYSIIIIFASHLARLVTMIASEGIGYFDTGLLPFIIIAAMLGGFLGANLSRIFSENVVKKLFITALSVVIILNIINGVTVLRG